GNQQHARLQSFPVQSRVRQQFSHFRRDFFFVARLGHKIDSQSHHLTRILLQWHFCALIRSWSPGRPVFPLQFSIQKQGSTPWPAIPKFGAKIHPKNSRSEEHTSELQSLRQLV